MYGEFLFMASGGPGVPEWIGSWVFLVAVVLTGAKLNSDMGRRGEIAFAMLLVLISIYALAVGLAFGYL